MPGLFIALRRELHSKILVMIFGSTTSRSAFYMGINDSVPRGSSHIYIAVGGGRSNKLFIPPIISSLPSSLPRPHSFHDSGRIPIPDAYFALLFSLPRCAAERARALCALQTLPLPFLLPFILSSHTVAKCPVHPVLERSNFWSQM